MTYVYRKDDALLSMMGYFREAHILAGVMDEKPIDDIAINILASVERRRRGRTENAKLGLIPLMRGTSSVIPDQPPIGGRRARDLDPSKGILLGVLIGALLWAVIVAAALEIDAMIGV
jgi:hypothetical protein